MNLEIKVNFKATPGQLKNIIESQVRDAQSIQQQRVSLQPPASRQPLRDISETAQWKSMGGGGRSGVGSGGAGGIYDDIPSGESHKGRKREDAIKSFEEGGALPKKALAAMSKDLPEQFEEAGSKSGLVFGSAFRRVAAAEIAAMAGKLGLPMQATWGLRAFLSSSSISGSTVALAATGVGLVGATVAAEREFESTMAERRTTGLYANLAGQSGRINKAMELPDFAASGSLYDILGLPGFLTEHRKRTFTTKAAMALEDVLPLGFSGEELGKFSQLSERMGIEPGDVAKGLTAETQGLPLEVQQRQNRRMMEVQRKESERIANSWKGWKNPESIFYIPELSADISNPVRPPKKPDESDNAREKQSISADTATESLAMVERLHQQREANLRRTGAARLVLSSESSWRLAGESLRSSQLQTSVVEHGLLADPSRRLRGELIDLQTNKANQLQALADTESLATSGVIQTSLANQSATTAYNKLRETTIAKYQAEENALIKAGQLDPKLKQTPEQLTVKFLATEEGKTAFSEKEARRLAMVGAQTKFTEVIQQSPARRLEIIGATQEAEKQKAALAEYNRNQEEVAAVEIAGQSKLRSLQLEAQAGIARTVEPAKIRKFKDEMAESKRKTEVERLVKVRAESRDDVWAAQLDAAQKDYDATIKANEKEEDLSKKAIAMRVASASRQSALQEKLTQITVTARLTDNPIVKEQKAKEIAIAERDRVFAEIKARRGKSPAEGGLTDSEADQAQIDANRRWRSENLIAETERKIAETATKRAKIQAQTGLAMGQPGLSSVGKSGIQLRGAEQERQALPEEATEERGRLFIGETGIARQQLYEMGARGFSIHVMAAEARKARKQTMRGARRLARMNEEDAFDQSHQGRAGFNDPDVIAARQQAEGKGTGENVAGSAAQLMLQAAQLMLQAAGIRNQSAGNGFRRTVGVHP